MKPLLCLLLAIVGCKKPEPARQEPPISGSAAPLGSAAATDPTPTAAAPPTGSATAPGDTTVDPARLQRTTMFAHTTLSTAAVADAKTTEELCRTSQVPLRTVATMLSSSDIVISPSIEKEFRDEQSGLLTSLRAFEDQYCGAAKTDVAAARAALVALTKRTENLVEIAAKAK